MLLIGSELQNLVDEYVDTYHRLISNTTPYHRLRTLIDDSDKLLGLSETLGTMIVNGSMGYTAMDEENKTTIYYRGSGFSSQFAKLHRFFNDETWERYVDFRTASASRHRCIGGPPCFSDTQDNLDVLTSLTKKLLEKLGVCGVFREHKNLDLFRNASRRFNPTTS